MNHKNTLRSTFLVFLLFMGSFVLTSCGNEETENEIKKLNKRISELENKNEDLESNYRDILERVDFLEEDLGYKVSYPNTPRSIPGGTFHVEGNKIKK